MDRRHFLGTIGAGLGLTGLGAGRAFHDTPPGAVPQPLTLTAAPTTVTHGGGTSEAWALNGVLPAPTLRLRRGDTAELVLRNQLTEPTILHWHGLDVPEAAVSVMVLDGTDEITLNRAVGHIEGTANPGEHGNVGIAGHRDSFFRGLRKLEVGDEIVFTTLEGRSHFEVTRLEVVKPEAVEVLDPTEHPTLTLVTCYPFYFVGDAPSRYIVSARQVRHEAWSPQDGPATGSSVLAKR